MPPVRESAPNKVFTPDYAALLLCDKVVLDTTTFDLLKQKKKGPYTQVSETIITLWKEGFIELIDFADILQRKSKVIEKMTNLDLESPDIWHSDLLESLIIWNRLLSKKLHWMSESTHRDLIEKAHEALSINDMKLLLTIEAVYLHELFHLVPAKQVWSPLQSKDDQLLQALLSSSMANDSAKILLKEVIEIYISYINSNIIISNELGVGIYDWVDFLPFYRRKFLSVGHEDLEADRQINATRALFHLSFPEFIPKDPSTLVKILSDKRIADLRALIQESVDKQVTFDTEFARAILWEVLKTEGKSARYQKIVSYLTMPIGFIPGFGPLLSEAAQTLATEVVGTGIDIETKKRFRWFYLLSDITGGYKKEE